MLKEIRTGLLLASVLCSGGAFASAQVPQPNTDALRYRYIGPVGNRVTSVAGVSGQPYVYYAGAASGGIFKTIDGGIHWDPIFDGQPELACTAKFRLPNSL